LTRYVFDIDGTLCSNTNGEYRSAKPMTERIDDVNALFDAGNYIVLFTARGMASSRGNKLLARIRWWKITKSQLGDWGVKYHELEFGKPAGDYYIDDKAISDLDFFSSDK
jgi:phosphoglycolate phosphatase-like HAD superfamily hydrolase